MNIYKVSITCPRCRFVGDVEEDFPCEHDAEIDRLRVELAESRAREERLRELLSRTSLKKYGQRESNVIEALMNQADRVRAHSGYDPGQVYDQQVNNIRAALAETKGGES